MKKKIVIRKIPVIYLLQTLQDIYDAGVVYVDIVGKRTKYEDALGIVVREDYDESEGIILPTKFDDRNINDIIV